MLLKIAEKHRGATNFQSVKQKHIFAKYNEAKHRKKEVGLY